MDFTRQPIIETIITPREGFRLVIRSSKNMGQEELFVDALEVVSFGAATLFFRSTERPKPFLVPASDYEVLEVREQRLMLKTPSSNSQENNAPRQRQQNDRQQNDRQQNDRQSDRSQNERHSERQSQDRQPQERQSQEPKPQQAASSEERPLERSVGEEKRDAQGNRPEKGRGRDRHRRRRGERGGERGGAPRGDIAASQAAAGAEMARDEELSLSQEGGAIEPVEPPPLFRTILPPPQTLIRDDLQRLRDSEVYRGAFFIREEKGAGEQDDDDASLTSIDADSEMHAQSKKEAPPQGESFRASEEYSPEVHANPPIPLP